MAKVATAVLKLAIINKIKRKGFLKNLTIIPASIGSKKTIELTFTPKAKPKNTEANIRNKILFCLRNFMMKSKDPNKKKVRADSGVAKWACWISHGVSITNKAAR